MSRKFRARPAGTSRFLPAPTPALELAFRRLGRREYIQVLRLLETFALKELSGAIVGGYGSQVAGCVMVGRIVNAEMIGGANRDRTGDLLNAFRWQGEL